MQSESVGFGVLKLLFQTIFLNPFVQKASLSKVNVRSSSIILTGSQAFQVLKILIIKLLFILISVNVRVVFCII